MPTHITRVQFGRSRSIQTQVLLWRKRKQAFDKLSAVISQHVLDAHNGDMDATVLWFNMPLPELKGKRPKDYYKPRNIKRLKAVVFKLFKKS